MNRVIEIPKALTAKGDLVIIPRKEYEEFSAWQKNIKFFTPTAKIKKALKQSREDLKKGNYLTIDELESKLGIKGRK